MAVDELEIVRLRKDFYRDGAPRIFLVLVILLLTIAILFLTSIYLYIQKPEPVTFVTNAQGRSFPSVPVNTPYFTDAELLQWFIDVIPKAFTLDFVNYQTQLTQASPFFTQQGWAKLSAILNTYANNTQVQAQKLFIVGEPSGAPIIINKRLLTEGPSSGHFAWLVQLPIKLRYSTGAATSETPISLQAMIIRTDSENDIAGLLIDDITATTTTPRAVPVTPGQTEATPAPAAPPVPSPNNNTFNPVPAPLPANVMPGQIKPEGAT